MVFSGISPAITYSNMDTQKKTITGENRGKCGVYRIINNESGKCYVGSSINLTVRFYMYFNLYHITKRNDSLICIGEPMPS